MSLLAYIRYAVRFMRDPGVPLWRKLLIGLVLFYFLFPFDFLPDLIPGLGWLDDLVVLTLGAAWFSRQLKNYSQQRDEPPRTDDAKTIDVEYTIREDDDREGSTKEKH